MVSGERGIGVGRRILTVLALAALAASCADDDASPSTSVVVTVESPAIATEPPPTPPATTVPPETVPPETVPPETVPPESTAAVAPARLLPRQCDVAATYRADCSWLEVPERRDIAGARTIRLWVAVIRQDGPDAALAPVVHVTGGPGDPASSGWVAGDVTLDGSNSRTLVIMDQRGTGRSEPRLGCPELDGTVAETEAYQVRRDDRRRLVAACRERLVAEGVDLDGYDSVENVADFVDLRRALGVDQFFLSGISYGGRLAREIYRQDPDGVVGMLLDSPITTAPTGPASLVERGDDAIDRLAAACAAQLACAATGSVEDNMVAAATRLDQQPYPAPDQDLIIDGGVVWAGGFNAMYESELLGVLPAAAAALAGGDDSILDPLAAELVPTYADERDESANGLFEIMTCADDGAALDEADRAAADSPGVWEDLLLGWGFDCDVWDVAPVDGGRLTAPTGDVPVLVTSGGLDPITPPRFADEVRQQFPNTTVVLVPAGGHGVAFFDECLTSISLAFTADPTAPLDTTCADDLAAPFAPAAG